MTEKTESAQQRLARLVRDACIEAALEAYENAGMSGLCHEGRWEVAIGEMRMVDLKALIARSEEER